MGWVTVCADSLRLSQAKTLGILVADPMRVQRISVANFGHSILTTNMHQIKRESRGGDYERVETADAMRPIVEKLLKKRCWKNKLLIALDWVDIKGFQALVASVVLKGRITPVAWASTTNHVYHGQPRERIQHLHDRHDHARRDRRQPPPEAFSAVSELSKSVSPKWG